MPVFAAIGAGGSEHVDALTLRPGIVPVTTPRHARILLVAGAIRDADRSALRLLHDQIPAPRATLWWGAPPFPELAATWVVSLDDDPLPSLVTLHERLWSDPARTAEPDLLPDEPPSPWRGVGEHGQGGEGMMGGKPYGRSMPMTADDVRDGLALDASTISLGPFWPVLPPGLVIQLTLQGDLVQDAGLVRAPYAAEKNANAQAIRLRRAGRLIDLVGLEALAERCRRLAVRAEEGATVDFARLRFLLRCTGAFAAVAPLRAHERPRAIDLRRRMEAWLGDAQTPPATTPLRSVGELLRGCEWAESMLLLNALTPREWSDLSGARNPEAASSPHDKERQR